MMKTYQIHKNVKRIVIYYCVHLDCEEFDWMHPYKGVLEKSM